MPNTMVSGERKKEENYINKEEEGLKNASFWAINSKKKFNCNSVG